MSDHAPEPWRVWESFAPWKGPGVVCDRHVVVLHCDVTTPENIRRIVACVNALAGIPDEVLPAVKDVLNGLLTVPVVVDGSWAHATFIELFLNHSKKEKTMCKCDPTKDSAEAVEELVGTDPADGKGSRNQEFREKLRQLEELTERAWGLITNAYGDDWDLTPKAPEATDWKAAAVRWRDAYHKTLPHSSLRVEEGEKAPEKS